MFANKLKYNQCRVVAGRAPLSSFTFLGYFALYTYAISVSRTVRGAPTTQMARDCWDTLG